MKGDKEIRWEGWGESGEGEERGREEIIGERGGGFSHQASGHPASPCSCIPQRSAAPSSPLRYICSDTGRAGNKSEWMGTTRSPSSPCETCYLDHHHGLHDPAYKTTHHQTLNERDGA